MKVGRTSTLEQGQSVPARPSGPHIRVCNSISPQDALHTHAPARPTCAGLVRPTGGTGDLLHPGLFAHFGCAALAQISLRRIELGGYATQDEAESLGSIASIISLLRHAQQHGEVDDREEGKVSQGFGNV